MRLTNHELLKAVRFALYASATAVVGLSSAPVFAQSEAGTENLETIVVTGSRIRRVDIEGASPVFSIDKADIERSGKLTIGDLIQESPSISGAATNTSVNNGGGSGAATVSLRGLGSQRTLLLVNGRRLQYADVNSIPINMVERIDILKDGASAIYGSDAVGGVVNFVLRKDFQGIEASVDYGISDSDDGERKGVQITIGHTSDRGSLIVGASYNKQDGVGAGDRDFSSPSLYNYNGIVNPSGSGSIPGGRFVLDRRVAVANGITCGGTGRTVSVVAINGSFGRTAGDYRCAVLDGAVNDLYDFSPFNLVLTPSERGGLFVVGNYRLTDTVEGYVEAFTNKTRSRSIIAPLPLILAQLGGPISADGAFNPFIDPTNPDGSPLIDPVTGDPVRADIRSGGLRDVTGGNRETLFDTTAEQISAGLRGSFGDTWQWDAGITFARLSQENASTGYYLLSGLAPAVGPSFIDANGVANCGTVGAPIPLTSCTPINIFNLDPTTPDGAISRAALNALALTVKSKTYANQKTAQFNLTGELFELPAGAVSLAVGGEYRADYTYVEPDFISTITNPLTGRCLTFTDACASPSVGDLSVREFYGELLVPLLRDLPFAKSLNLTLGSRYSDYSAFGNTTNSKIGLEWRPIDDLLLRGTIAEVFRAPTISDLFSGTSTNAATYLDPCDNLAAEDVTNPACAGLVAGFEQITPQTQALNTSNANLLPEKGQTVTWGAVYDPSWLPGLSTSLDVWKVQLSDTIGSLGTQTILDQCFKFGRFCDLFTRGLGPGDTGDVNFVQNQTQQVGRIDTKGIDYSIKYRLPETSFGNFRVSLDTTYIAQYDVEFVEGTISTRFPRAGTYQGSAFGGDGNYARVRALGALSWNMGPFDASWRTRFVSATKFGAFREAGDGSNVVDPTQDPTQDSYRIGGITYHNFAAGYNAEVINTRFDMGVDNVFAKQPPILWQYGFNGNTDERTYDTVGRYYWARVAVKF